MSSLYIVLILGQVFCARILLNIRDVMSATNYSEAAVTAWSGSSRSDRERQVGASNTNAGGEGNLSHRSRHKQLDEINAGLGVESWEMHRLGVSRLRHAMQLRDPQHPDEEPSEVEGEPDITAGISQGAEASIADGDGIAARGTGMLVFGSIGARGIGRDCTYSVDDLSRP
jgi:hypothetical protein